MESSVGKAGGYRLTRPPGEYPVGEILRAAEGDLCAVSCISEEKAGCGSVCDCGTRSFWQGLEAQINTYVDHYTLAQSCIQGKNQRPLLRRGRRIRQYEEALLEIKDLHVRVEDKEICTVSI